MRVVLPSSDRLRGRGRREGIPCEVAKDRDHLRHAIERFMVRRTIRTLKAAISREPDAHRDAAGEQCRYPQQQPCIYRCPEDAWDQAIGQRNRDEAERLRSIIYLSTVLTPTRQDERGHRPPEDELRIRLDMAASLAAYYVISSVRSSRAALLEHIVGTEQARAELALADPIKPEETGNHIRNLEHASGLPPENRFSVPLPHWLADPEAHAQTCREEIDIYRRIAALTRELSGAREAFKAQLLIQLLETHRKIVAFDWHLITLSVIKQQLGAACAVDVLIATGADTTMRRRVRDLFDPDIEGSDVAAIALCSDAMSESIGLQRTSAIVHLDMPSTIRKAEQRIGRLMRMNSPHPTIEVHWPLGADTLALRSDERIVERHRIVDVIIGANIELPPELEGELTQTDHLIRRTEEDGDRTWEDLGDAFAPVRSLHHDYRLAA
jgi:Helicase conserved C-terminal domain